MRKLIATMLFGGGALAIISFGDGIVEKNTTCRLYCVRLHCEWSGNHGRLTMKGDHHAEIH